MNEQITIDPVRSAVKDPNIRYWVEVLGERAMDQVERSELIDTIGDVAFKDHGVEAIDRKLLFKMIQISLPKRGKD